MVSSSTLLSTSSGSSTGSSQSTLCRSILPADLSSHRLLLRLLNVSPPVHRPGSPSCSSLLLRTPPPHTVIWCQPPHPHEGYACKDGGVLVPGSMQDHELLQD